MHVLVKWIESDTVFGMLGALIVGIGIFLLTGLTVYTWGYLI